MNTTTTEPSHMETTKSEKLLRDLYAFALEMSLSSVNESQKCRILTSTLLHDIGGYLAKERCFVPRCDGYSDNHPAWQSYLEK